MDNIDAMPFSSQEQALEANTFAWDGNGFEAGIGIAASGGGFRAMLFHVGAFVRLAELGLLQQARRISAVSGGSIATAWLACVWPDLVRENFANMGDVFVEPMLDFARSRIDFAAAVMGLLPGTSAAAQVAKVYDRHLFRGRSLQDLPDQPQFMFCASNLQTGVLWRFCKDYAGDYLVGRIDRPNFPLAQAVAASSAFPPILSPMILDFADGSFEDWPTAPRRPVPGIGNFRKNVILTDGGVYDNHGIEPLVKRFATLFVSDGGAPFGRNPRLYRNWVSQLRRILDVTDNQVRALRRHDLIGRFRGAHAYDDEASLVTAQAYARFGAYWGIDTDPSKLVPNDALPCSVDAASSLSAVPTRLTNLGDDVSEKLVNWGYAICDRSVRANYTGTISPVAPVWLFPGRALT
ncbi:patatin-like phospholipase family protein [Rhizobium sp. P38BS-XIX]|uniref:patatin-like phospholipase family protein n=1 Tax=Rhizobium sp. P38BS-XIX TaxID=2726740 RepID=UPI001456F33D|nr:patatin-like phospholipase family protein [Rhizobium sp. P38BS-XIX]NLR98132.1 patatin-like phospholipase family protein [Rhizobium sp. P38BS-XIX]